MEYNSEKKLLKYPEYGRHIQALIENSGNIEDPEERQAYMNKLVRLVKQMNSEYKTLENSDLKVWQNIYNILGDSVELQYPEEVDKSPEEERYNKAHTLSYPTLNKRYRQQGGNVQKMLAKAIEMEDEAKKLSYIRYIGSYMKNVHRTWNNDNSVHDDVIKNEIKKMTDGVIDLDEVDISFNVLGKLSSRNQIKSSRKPKQGKHHSSKKKKRRK